MSYEAFTSISPIFRGCIGSIEKPGASLPVLRFGLKCSNAFLKHSAICAFLAHGFIDGALKIKFSKCHFWITFKCLIWKINKPLTKCLIRWMDETQHKQNCKKILLHFDFWCFTDAASNSTDRKNQIALNMTGKNNKNKFEFLVFENLFPQKSLAKWPLIRCMKTAHCWLISCGLEHPSSFSIFSFSIHRVIGLVSSWRSSSEQIGCQ